MCAQSLRQALDESGVEAADLTIVVSVGMSRDYLPSWSLATEAMKLVGAPSTCLGVDLTIGCLGTLVGLTTVLGWLLQEGGGYGAIVCGERWAYTIDRSRDDLMSLWGHSDGGGALVVGVGTPQPSLGEYRGACFTSYADDNGRLLIRYGGTRFPITPPGETPFFRTVDPSTRRDAKRRHLGAYSDVLDGLVAKYGVLPQRVVVNQVSTGIVRELYRLAGVAEDHVVCTGHDSGHLGPADVVLGLRQLFHRGENDTPIAIVSSTAYAFGAGLLLPPA
jgi:3-oxoacyl-[acyl-carrier-protein] synthase III